jgi:exopolysaccharide production protein ExoZ
VVLFHLGHFIANRQYFGIALFAQPFNWGDAGVPFFFVLSGFLLPWIHFADVDDPRKLPSYLRKRVVRIYPIYWLIFAVTAGAATLMPHPLLTVVPGDPVTIVKGLLLLPQDRAILHGTAPVLAQAWTLTYEVCFYVLIGIFIVRSWLGALAVALLGVNLVSCHYTGCTFPRSFFAGPYMLQFAMGVAVALLVRFNLRLARPGTLALVAGSLFIALGVTEAVLGHHLGTGARLLLYGGFSAALIWGLVQWEARRPLPEMKVWSHLGDASYVLYLVHLPLMEAMCELARGLGVTRAGTVGASLTYVAILFTCIAAALLLHRRVEKPLLRWLSKPPSRRQHATVPSAS